MKIALICPSNILYMPYVKNYENVLVEQNIDYDIINWDRFQIEEIRETTYRDKKKGHQRNFLDYLKYKKFLMNRLNSIHYDKLIVFGIQLSYFLKKTIKNKFNEKYIIDIRDHNKILNFFNFKEVIESSAFTVLSSPGYKEWLPKSSKYVVNHNTQIPRIDELKEIRTFNQEVICISNIGAITEFHINIDFINSLKNNPKFKLNYHGEGNINDDLISYFKTNGISNVYVTGRYIKEDEEKLYESSDLINVLRTSDGINNKTALPNRLYNAVFYGKPLIACVGSYLADEIANNNIGIVLDSFDDVENKIFQYIEKLDYLIYNKGRERFMEKVIQENKHFEDNLKIFVQ